MHSLFYVVVLSVYAIGCSPNGKGNFNLKGLDLTYQSFTSIKGAPFPEDTHRSLGTCPVRFRNDDSTCYIERQANQPANLTGFRNILTNLHGDDGLSRGVEVSNQRSLASTGAVPRHYRPSTTVRYSSTPREECTIEDLYTSGASSCRANPGCARNCGSSSTGTPCNLPRFNSSNPNQLQNNSERIPEEYGPHEGARSLNAASGSRTSNTMIRTQTADVLGNSLRKRSDNQRPEINNLENVSDFNLETDLMRLRLSRNNRQQETGASSVINPRRMQIEDSVHLGKPVKDNQARTVKGSKNKGNAESFLTINLSVDPRAGRSNREIDAEALYRERSIDLRNLIMAGETEFRRLFNELASLVVSVTDVEEFRLEISSTMALFETLGSHLNRLIEAVDEFSTYFIHDTINIARQQVRYFVDRFIELKKSFCTPLTSSLTTPTSYSVRDRQTVAGHLYTFITLSENVMKVLQNMLQAVAVYWERIDSLN